MKRKLLFSIFSTSVCFLLLPSYAHATGEGLGVLLGDGSIILIGLLVGLIAAVRHRRISFALLSIGVAAFLSIAVVATIDIRSQILNAVVFILCLSELVLTTMWLFRKKRIG